MMDAFGLSNIRNARCSKALHLLASVCVLALFVLVPTPALADWSKPVPPPKSATPAPVLPPSQSSPAPIPAPSTGGFPGSIAPPVKPLSPAPVDPAYSSLPPLIEQMLGGKITPQRAWEEKLLSGDDLLWIFTSYLDPWGSFRSRFNVPLRRALAALLAGHGGDRLQEPDKLPPSVRLWLADYYLSVQDERTMPLCESILRDIKAPMQGDAPLAFQAIEWLGRYYTGKGDSEKAAQAWQRMSDYYPAGSWWLADALIEGGRVWLAAGEFERARELYAKVPAYGPDWFTGLARWDEAHALLRAGQSAEARRLLSAPLPGEGKEPVSAESGKMRVALLALLAWSHYKAGEWEKAHKIPEQAVQRHAALPGQPMDKGLGAQVAWARAMSQWSQRFAQAPLWCQPASVTARVAAGGGPQEFTLRLAVRSERAAPLTVTVDNPLVRIEPVKMGAPVEKAVGAQQDYLLKIGPHDFAQPLRAQVTVSSPQWPQATRTVPLSIEADAVVR